MRLFLLSTSNIHLTHVVSDETETTQRAEQKLKQNVKHFTNNAYKLGE